LNYTWKRLRRCLKKLRNPAEYEAKLAELKDLLSLESQGFIKIYYADESGFNLTPNVPYGWQPKGEQSGILSQRSPTTNVFGLLSKDNDFEGYTLKGSMNAACLISFIDDFASGLKQRTVIVLDNVSFHHSALVKAKMAEWKEMDLLIWFLPTYSPHLNLIETLWRKIKYEWLKPHHYACKDTFDQALAHILTNIGSEFVINFT